MKSNGTFCRIFLYRAMLRENQHGRCEYDDLQSWLDMTSHENPLLNRTTYCRVIAPWRISGSLRITNINGNVNRNVKFLFKTSQAVLILNRNFTFVFLFLFMCVIRKLYIVLLSPRAWLSPFDFMWKNSIDFVAALSLSEYPNNLNRYPILTLIPNPISYTNPYHKPNPNLKASQIGHYVMVSAWCASLSTNTRFRFLYFRINNC